ncbi:DUF1918 domain-containing protein [Actinoplanes awajinensis]|uniref:DNA-binding protein n=1 Tax=Actinoplanes awajinensis subsp. mycoplanecinus TaxID=135947 RepID=A0A101JAZ8_9ACTN|nr:DUF1918 domain-containing protein [Actinoplanes awajinensis]KUL23444.1 DNA-binding protein [Actinoplanes awajinensis subsp. mycoplanecinus]
MKAQIGDRIIVEGVHLGDSRRIGIVTALTHDDGRPPYQVRWLNDGHTSVFFPGVEARVEPAGGGEPTPAG